MRSLLASLAIAIFSIGAVACGRAGHASKSAGSASRASSNSAAPETNDAEEDRSHADADDDGVLLFGQAAGAADTRAVTALVKRYYAAAAASDGATGCSLLYSTIAGTVVENYGQPPGPPALRGGSCAVVMSKLFKQHRRQLAAEVATMQVTGVRVKGDQGLALLNFGSPPERHMLVRRERGAWKIGVFLDIGMP
jgi:hypothetical protein